MTLPLKLTGAEPTFDEFYDAYVKKVAKGRARKAWAKLTPAQKELALDAAKEHNRRTAAWRTRNSDPRIPYPATWLNDERWEDDPEVWDHPPCSDEQDVRRNPFAE